MANEEIGNLAVRVSMDSTGFQNGISGINKQLAVVKSEFKAASAELGGFGSSSDQLRLKSESLNQQIDLQKQRVQALEQAFQNSAEKKGADATATQNLQIRLNNARAALANMENELTNTNRQIDLQSSGWTRLSDTLSSIGQRMKDFGTSLTKVGKSLTTTITAPLVGIGAAAEKSALTFEDGMAKVATIADTTAVPLEKLKQGVLDVSNQTGASTDDLNEALYQTISAGVKTADAVKFLDDSVKLAKGGFTDTTTAVDVLSTAVNAYGLKASDAATISDQLITTQNLGKTTVAELGQSLGNVIPIAASVNVGTKELFASLAELTKNGIKTDEAVTGLKGAYSAILSPSSQAATEAQKLGLDFSAAHLKAVGWAEFLNEIKEKTGGSGEAMSQLFGNVRALTAVMTLAGKGSSDFNNILSQMNNTAGATDAAFNKVQNTSGVKLKKAFNDIKNAGIQLGEALTPMVEKVAGVVEELADKFKNLSPVQQQLIVNIGIIAAALGPLLVVIGSLIKNIGLIAGVFSKASAAIAEAGGIIEVLSGPIGIAIAVIAGLIAVGVLLYKNWDGIKAKAQEVWDAVQQVFSSVGTFFANIWSSAISVMENAWNGSGLFFTNLWKGVELSTENVWNDIKTFFQTVWTSIVSVVTGIVTGFVTSLNNTFTKQVGDISVIFESLKIIFQNVWQVIENIILGAILIIIDLVTGNFTKMKEDTESIFQNLSDLLTNIWENIKNIFEHYLDLIKTTLSQAWTEIEDLATTTWNEIKTFFENLWTDIKTTATTAWTDFQISLTELWNDIVQDAKDIWNGLINWLEDLPQNLKTIAINMFNSMKDGVTATIPSVITAIENGITSAIDWIKDLPSQALQWGKDMIQGFINGIESMGSSIKSTLSDVGNTIRSYLHFSTPDQGPLTDYEQWMPDFMSGLAAGIEKNKNKVTQAIQGLSNDIKFNVNASLVPSPAGSVGGSGSTVNNSYSYGALLHTDKIVISNDMDIQTLANKLEFYREQMAKAKGGS